MDMINIVADDRECRSGVPALIEARDNAQLTIARLPLGDYCIDNWLLVERKTLADLLQSIISGRVFNQACRLANADKASAIILEGRTSTFADYRQHRNAILGTVVTLSLIYGLTILRAADPHESVNLMLFAAQQKQRKDKTLLARCARRPHSFYKKQLFMIQGLPDIGPTSAQRLLQHFGSVKAVVNADPAQLAQVQGIGAGKADKIYRLVTAILPKQYELPITGWVGH